MKLACQEGLVPGTTLKEKCENLAAWGYKGIEFGGGGLAERVGEVNAACDAAGIRACSICSGYPGVLLSDRADERKMAVDGIKELFKVAADIGAVGVIAVPLFGGPKLPDLSPLMGVLEAETQLLIKLCEQLAPAAEDAGVCLLLEPLNRYETHLINRLEQAVAICEAVPSPGIQLMADFFHMSIEERDIPSAIKGAGAFVKHVHLAESTRLFPNPEYGHTDFKAGFTALKEASFKNYMAIECIPTGKDRATELKATAAYLNSCI